MQEQFFFGTLCSFHAQRRVLSATLQLPGLSVSLCHQLSEGHRGCPPLFTLTKHQTAQLHSHSWGLTSPPRACERCSGAQHHSTHISLASLLPVFSLGVSNVTQEGLHSGDAFTPMTAKLKMITVKHQIWESLHLSRRINRSRRSSLALKARN